MLSDLANALDRQECDCVLDIRPIHPSRTKKQTRAFVVETPISFDITREGQIERLTKRSDPVQDWAFYALCIIRPGA